MNNTGSPVVLTGHQWFSHHTAKLDDSKEYSSCFVDSTKLKNWYYNYALNGFVGFFFLTILLKTELPQMLLLQSLYESDELRSAEWLGRNPGGDLSSWVIGLCSEVLLRMLMKNGIEDLPLTSEQLNVFEWAPFLCLWTMFIPKLLKWVFSLPTTDCLHNNHRRLLSLPLLPHSYGLCFIFLCAILAGFS